MTKKLTNKPRKKKIAISCSLSNSHVIFFDHLIKSVLKHNPKFNHDINIFCRPGKSAHKYDLTQRNRNHLKSLYSKIIFNEIDVDLYLKYRKSAAIFYSIELFSLRGYDAVIHWGADMLCLKSLDELFEYAADIDGVAMPREKRRGCFNNGSMIIGKKYLNDKTYNDLVKFEYWLPQFSQYFGNDQKIYNIYFSGKIKESKQKFNVMVSETGFIGWGDILLLHYFYKPTADASRRHLTSKMIAEWEQYDNPQGRYADVDN